jgi:ABC-type branched-subunit amino acid transport system permease subunit
LMQDVIYPTSVMFGSRLSVTAARPHFGSFDGGHDKHFYYLVLGLAVCCVAVMAFISRSRLGRLLRAMAETPTMLATHGLGVNMTRLIVFCVSAFFAGCAGALVVTQFGAASGVGYGPIQSLLFLAVLAICGTRLVRSSILAAGLLAVAPGYLTKFNVDRQTFAFGLVAIAASIVIAKRAEIAAFFTATSRPSGSVAQRPSRTAVTPSPRGARTAARAPSGAAR